MRRLLPIGLLLIAGCVNTSPNSTSFEVYEFGIKGSGILDNPNQLTVENSGEFAHTLVVTNSDGQVVAATDAVQPGGSADLVVDLETGMYSFTCRIVVEAQPGVLIDHYEEGMSLLVEVVAEATDAG